MSVPESVFPQYRSQLIAYGHQWEDAVVDYLKAEKWKVSLYGQRANNGIQEVLRGTSSTARFDPDICASKGNAVVWIDAKNSDPRKTGNHAVNQAAMDAHLQWMHANQDPHLFAFPDGHGGICWMAVQSFAALMASRSGKSARRGTGQDFCVVSHAHCYSDPIVCAMKAGLWTR